MTTTREPDWGTAPPFGRRETLLRTLRQLWTVRPGAARIVETGAARSESGMLGDGWSTVAWGWYALQTGGRVTTVDCDAGALETCRRLTEPFAPAIEYVCGDSVEWLRRRSAGSDGRIDLLYLDSFDWIDRERSEAHNLAEAESALPHLAPGGLVLIDDMHPTGEVHPGRVPAFDGKGRQTVPFLLTRGFALQWYAGGQVLLARAGRAPRAIRRRAAH